MTLGDLFEALVTAVLYVNVAVFVGAIVVANVYAFLHAWRSDRVLWAVALAAFFVLGAGVATAAYLILHHDEPLPGGFPWRRRALAR